jgi:hypothetical protein
MDDRALLGRMAENARTTSLSRSWDAVFDDVYSSYQTCIEIAHAGKHEVTAAEQGSNAKAKTWFGVTSTLFRHPIKEILWRWNWKTAILSASMRAAIFLFIYLQQRQGLLLSLGAFSIQFALRAFVGGVSGSIIQSYSRVQPAWHAVVSVPLAVVFLSHILEFSVQAFYDSVTESTVGTRAVIVSILVSAISILFNLFAMQRGALLVQVEEQPTLWADLKRLPAIVIEFLLLPVSWAFRRP